MKILVNPLLKIENNFNLSSSEERAKEINESFTNIPQVFIKNYVNYVYHIKPNSHIGNSASVHVLEGILYGSFNWNQSLYQEYAEWEIQSLKGVTNIKEQAYLDFLIQNNHSFFILDQLHADFKTPHFETIAFYSDTLSNKLYGLDAHHLARELNKFSNFLLQWCRYNLLTTFKLKTEGSFNYKNSQVFSIVNLMKRIEASSTTDKELAIELIKKYIDQAAQEFYSKSEITETILPHKFILSEIEKYYELAVGKKELVSIDKPDFEFINSSMAKLSPTQNYPKHIFKDEQSYMLFHTIAEEMTKPAQLSFLFRQMSETEKPTMIICRDAVFREWFNTEGYSLELENVTKRLSDASTADRLTLYKLAKKLLHINN
jgi:hypothetical protein